MTMNLRKTCPDIPDSWKGGVSDVARLLGETKPLSTDTIYKYVKLGRRNGGINSKRGLNGRLQISGKETKYLWSIL